MIDKNRQAIRLGPGQKAGPLLSPANSTKRARKALCRQKAAQIILFEEEFSP